MAKTADYSNLQLVVIATHLAGGVGKTVDTEDIAIKVHALAPGRFSWKKYPEQIDLRSVQKRLYDARLEKNGSLVEGSDKSGWVLTQSGLCWAQSQIEWIEKVQPHLEARREIKSGIAGQRHTRERHRILSSGAYKLYLGGKIRDISIRDAEKIFRIDEYVNRSARAAKITRLLDLFQKEKDIYNFLNEMGALIGKTCKD